MARNLTHSVYVTLGATNHSKYEREENDFYATDPKALEMLLDIESFSHNVWECACGAGHLSKVLEKRGYNVLSTDLIDRGFGQGGVDFLEQDQLFDGDIITNPPYRIAKEFVEHAIERVMEGHKVAMFLKLQFLDGRARRELFDKYPPKTIYVSTGRISCYRNGYVSKEQKNSNNAQAFAWFIWESGYKGETVIKWFN